MRSWSTQDIERRRALAYWVDTVGQVLLELEIEAAVPERFTASLQQSRLGPAGLNLIDASEQWMRRTKAGIARSQSPSVYLLQLRTGEFELQQYGRECRIQVGDCVLIDSEEPYELSCPGTHCLPVSRLPAAMAEQLAAVSTGADGEKVAATVVGRCARPCALLPRSDEDRGAGVAGRRGCRSDRLVAGARLGGEARGGRHAARHARAFARHAARALLRSRSEPRSGGHRARHRQASSPLPFRQAGHDLRRRVDGGPPGARPADAAGPPLRSRAGR